MLGNNRGQRGLRLTPHICKAFHGPSPSQNNNLPASGAEAEVSQIREEVVQLPQTGKQGNTSYSGYVFLPVCLELSNDKTY